MAKRYNIRWSDKDEKELKRLVTNFNAKIYYQQNLAKKKVDAEFLPKKLRMKDLRPSYDKGGNLNPTKPSTITTRQDFNRVKNSIARFSRRDATEIVKTSGNAIVSKYKLQEANIKKATVEKNRRAEARRLDLSTDKGTGHALRTENLTTSMKPMDELDQEDFDRRVLMLEKEIASKFSKESAIAYVDNMKRGFNNQLGGFASNILKLLEGVDVETIRDISLSDPVLLIDFVYGREDTFFRATQSYNKWKDMLIKNGVYSDEDITKIEKAHREEQEALFNSK